MKKLMTWLCVLVFLTGLMACATTSPDGSPSAGRSAAASGVAGAVAGGVFGALCGLIPGGSIAASVARGAIVGVGSGLVAGAVAGYIHGQYQERLYRDRLAAEAFHHYKADEGEKVVVEEVEIQPAVLIQGDKATLSANYSVLTGNDDPIAVEILQTVMSQNQACGQGLYNKGDKKSGSYLSTIPLEIPENLPEGEYQLETVIKTPKAVGRKLRGFKISKKPTPAPAPEPQEKPATEPKGAS